MNDGLITNPSSYYDDLCNQIILYSSTVSKEIGISYSELWIGVMGIIFLLIMWYNILLLFGLYSPFKRTIKWLFWISNIIILILSFYTLGDFLVFCKYDL